MSAMSLDSAYCRENKDHAAINFIRQQGSDIANESLPEDLLELGSSKLDQDLAQSNEPYSNDIGKYVAISQSLKNFLTHPTEQPKVKPAPWTSLKSDKETSIEQLLFGSNDKSQLESLGSSQYLVAQQDLSRAVPVNQVNMPEDGRKSKGGIKYENVSSIIIGFENEEFHPSQDQDDLIGDGSQVPINVHKKIKCNKDSLDSFVPAWTDHDDDQFVNIASRNRTRKFRTYLDQVNIPEPAFEECLRQQFSTINQSEIRSWAKLDKDMEASSDEDQPSKLTQQLLESSKQLVQPQSLHALSPKCITMIQLRDANHAAVSNSVVKSCYFHPTSKLFLTSGLDETLRLFDIDGRMNPLLQSMSFNHFAISSACFSPSGNEIYLCGMRSHFFVYNILTGRVDTISNLIGCKNTLFGKMLISPDGHNIVSLVSTEGKINVISNDSKHWLFHLKMVGTVECACFSPIDSTLWTAGSAGEVYIWDIHHRVCLRRFKDEGTSPIFSMKISPCGGYLAIGQESGIVNLYQIRDPGFNQSNKPKPYKTMYNLVTKVTIVEFNHDSQLLCIVSDELKNAIRLVHLPSGRVYNNWPNIDKLSLSRITSFAFSSDSQMMAVGNVRGRVRLFKIQHYNSTKVRR